MVLQRLKFSSFDGRKECGEHSGTGCVSDVDLDCRLSYVIETAPCDKVQLCLMEISSVIT